MQSPVMIRNQNGSILIPVIAFLMLAGVFLSFGIDFLKLRSPEEDRRRTINDMNFIVSELSSYVQKNNRIPCPASPSLAKTDPNFGTEARTSPTDTKCTLTEGIIPTRALFLPESFMKDSWGRYYTYAISPVYADTDSSSNIYQNCRTLPWFYSVVINVEKAHFCCPDIATYGTSTDLSVRSLAGTTDFISGRPATGYASPGLLGVPSPAIESAAIVLISHGQNGVGSFLSDGTGAKMTSTIAADEAENANGDRNYVQNTTNTLQALYFDDIVVYKSQLQLMSELNDGSCMRPFFSYTPDLMDEPYP